VFVQDNESCSRDRYTVRGLHYQAPPFAQDKLVRVVKGRIFDVAVDVRSASSTYGRWVGVELSEENGKQLLAPKGFLHGFMTLEPHTIVAYKVTNFYDAASDGAVYWASPELDIDWPAGEGQAVLSSKDEDARRFADFDSPF
ncbi:MAG: dTDP-4-dehydrorhamnose 3,5-epimerase, partial [Pseudomonadota bacterium]